MTAERKEMADRAPQRWPGEGWLAEARASPASAWIAEDARIRAVRYARGVAGRLLRRWALRSAARLARPLAERKEPRRRAWDAPGHR